MQNEPSVPVPKFIRRLMPTASEWELLEATERFQQYMAVVRRIYDRIALERAERDSRESETCGRVQNIPDV